MKPLIMHVKKEASGKQVRYNRGTDLSARLWIMSDPVGLRTIGAPCGLLP